MRLCEQCFKRSKYGDMEQVKFVVYDTRMDECESCYAMAKLARIPEDIVWKKVEAEAKEGER